MAKEPKRPKNLIERIPTQGGSWVDVTWGETAFSAATTTVYAWDCHGCPKGTGLEPTWKRNTAVDQAEKHAATCTAAHRR